MRQGGGSSVERARASGYKGKGGACGPRLSGSERKQQDKPTASAGEHGGFATVVRDEGVHIIGAGLVHRLGDTVLEGSAEL